MYAGLPAPKSMMILHGAGHYTFSNMCQLYPGLGDGCGEGYIDFDRALLLTNMYAMAFIRYHVLEEERDAQYLSAEYADTVTEVTWQTQE